MQRHTKDHRQGSKHTHGGAATVRARRPLAAMIATALAASGVVFATAPINIAFAATITVNTTANSDDGLCSLQEAIQAAITDATQDGCLFSGDDEITFNIIGGDGPFLIDTTNSAGLPAITGTMTIDATTQPGYTPGNPQIIIDGGVVGGFPAVDMSGSTASTFAGFIVLNSDPPSTDGGIVAGAASVIRDNWIGLNEDGTAASNIGTGVLVDGRSAVTIRDNVISGNDDAIRTAGTVSGLLIENNRIGTNPAGTAAIGNTQGITIGSFFLAGNATSVTGSS